MKPTLEVGSITKSFAGVQVVHDVSFSVEAGEIAVIVGPSGAASPPFFAASPDSSALIRA